MFVYSRLSEIELDAVKIRHAVVDTVHHSIMVPTQHLAVYEVPPPIDIITLRIDKIENKIKFLSKLKNSRWK